MDLLLVLFQKVIQSSEEFYFYFKSLFNFLLLEAVNYTTVLTSLYRKASPTERKETQIPTGNKRFQQKSSTTIITHGGEQKPHFLDFPCQNTAEFPTPVQLCHRLFWIITSGLIWAQSVCAEPLHPPKLSRSILWDAFELLLKPSPFIFTHQSQLCCQGSASFLPSSAVSSDTDHKNIRGNSSSPPLCRPDQPT